MERKRYQVLTFRGYLECSDYDLAVSSAKLLVQEIKNDKFGKEYWWAEIYDRNKRVSRVVSLRGNYCWSLSAWFRLR